MEAEILRAMDIIWIWLDGKCIMSYAYDTEEKNLQRLTEEEYRYCLKNKVVNVEKIVTKTSMGINYVKYKLIF